jgi:RimJ/RimL family protein N-acetyltransferase
MKVRHEARGTLGLKLSSHVIAQAKQKGYALGECFIIDGNEKMIKVLEWLGTKIFTRALAGHAMIYQIPPVRNYRVDKSYSIRHACEKDIPRIAELLREQYRDYSSSPVFNRDEFIHMLRADASFGIENFKIAEKDGQIVACAAFWDQQTIRRTVVEEFSRKGALAVSVLRFMNPLLKLPSLPSRGDVLKYIYLRFPAHEPDHSAALRAIIRQESNHLRKLRLYHFIWAGFHQADPLASCINGMVKLNMKVNIFHLKFSDEVELISETLSDSKPVYVDFSLI